MIQIEGIVLNDGVPTKTDAEYRTQQSHATFFQGQGRNLVDLPTAWKIYVEDIWPHYLEAMNQLSKAQNEAARYVEKLPNKNNSSPRPLHVAGKEPQRFTHVSGISPKTGYYRLLRESHGLTNSAVQTIEKKCYVAHGIHFANGEYCFDKKDVLKADEIIPISDRSSRFLLKGFKPTPPTDFEARLSNLLSGKDPPKHTREFTIMFDDFMISGFLDELATAFLKMNIQDRRELWKEYKQTPGYKFVQSSERLHLPINSTLCPIILLTPLSRIGGGFGLMCQTKDSPMKAFGSIELQ